MTSNWNYRIEHRGQTFTGVITAPDAYGASRGAANAWIHQLGPLGSGCVKVTVENENDSDARSVCNWDLKRDAVSAQSNHLKDLKGKEVFYGNEDVFTLTWFVNGEKRFSHPLRYYQDFEAPELDHLFDFGSDREQQKNWEPNETYVCIFDMNGEELVHAEVTIDWRYWVE
jgi:hypothetical protein